MTDFCCLTAIVFALVFGSLILVFAAANVAGIESERERAALIHTYQMPEGDWAAHAGCVIADGFLTERAAQEWAEGQLELNRLEGIEEFGE